MSKKTTQARRSSRWRSLLHGFAGSVLALGALAPRVSAEPPPHIERWHGVQRVDTPPPPPAPASEVKQAVLTTSPAPPPPPAPPAPLPPELVSPISAAPATPGPSVIILANAALPGDPRLEGLLRPPSASTTVETPPAPPRREQGSTEPPPPCRAAESPAALDFGALLSGAWLPLLCLGVAILMVPLVGAGVLLVLLRRLSSGPLLRIEYINNQPAAAYPGVILGTLPGGIQPPPAAPAPAAPMPAPPLAAEPEPTGELFELGPTYAEEFQQRQQQGKQQEQAVLQQLFEDNLRLRGAMRQLQTAEA